MNKTRYFGFNHRARQLLNGQWVAEERWLLFWWEAIDLRCPSFTWSSRSTWSCYKDCFGTEEEAINALSVRARI